MVCCQQMAILRTHTHSSFAEETKHTDPLFVKTTFIDAVTSQYITLSTPVAASPNNLRMATTDIFQCQLSILSHSAFESA